ncbi:MAG: ATP-binding cassette domain-containing protein [Alphaproteobacteria bacterium]|nr:ATP-binding cassette domain-containing protein [Alphaproteobacteria bacterium]
MTGVDQPRMGLSGVTRSFDGIRALDNVDLRVNPRQSLVLIGGSGSGKSLLLKCILGLVNPEAGSIEVDGMSTIGMSDSARMDWMKRFGVLFQRQGLFDSMLIWENVAFRLLNEGDLSRAEARDRAIERLGQVGLLPETADLYPSEVSGGMQKRVGLARAIATDPDILFLDEPTAGLDPIMSTIISELINERVDELGATVISIVSDLAVVRNIADSVVMLHEGRVVWSGPVAELDETDNPYVRQFITQSVDGPIEMPKLAG